MVNSKHVTGLYCVYVSLSRCFGATAYNNHSLVPCRSNRVEDDHHRQHRTILSSSADKGHGTGCSTHTASSTLSGGMADVGLIDPWVGVEVDVRELRRNAVDQLASGYNSSQSATLPVGV